MNTTELRYRAGRWCCNRNKMIAMETVPLIPLKTVYVKEIDLSDRKICYFKFMPNGMREVYHAKLGWLDNGPIDQFAWRDDEIKGGWVDSYVDEEEVFNWIISNGG